ncbi:unnamed protein product [Boreogadus saida]
MEPPTTHVRYNIHDSECCDDPKYILGIINENHHWKLTVMIPSQKKALLLDPLGESSTDINGCKDVTRQTIQKQTRTYNGFPVNGADAGIIRAVQNI